MKRKKKILAWLLSVAMALTSMNVMVSAAADSDPAETQETVAEDAAQPVPEEDGNMDAALPAEENVDVEPAAHEDGGYPASEHPYADSYDNTWDYTLDGAANGVYVTFGSQTEVESGYDFIYIYDSADKQIGRYTGTDLAGAIVYLGWTL